MSAAHKDVVRGWLSAGIQPVFCWPSPALVGEGRPFPDMNQGPRGPAVAPSLPLPSAPSSPGLLLSLSPRDPSAAHHPPLLSSTPQGHLWEMQIQTYVPLDSERFPTLHCATRTALQGPGLPGSPAVPLSAQPAPGPPCSHHLTRPGDLTPSQTI